MMQNKNIVLTGCNSGIGLESLNLLLGHGNKILCVDINTDKLEVLASDEIVIFKCDVSTKEGVDSIFAKANETFDFIDIFFANAGFPYYESYDYCDWDRIDRIFRTNAYSQMYTYSKYVEYLNGRDGKLAFTVSAIGKLAMPGFTLYSASKFAAQGFQQGVRYEMPKNLKLTCLYPISTDTNFFNVATEKKMPKPFPVQSPAHVAKCMIKGIEKGKKYVNPSKLFVCMEKLFFVLPCLKAVYLWTEKLKFRKFLEQK